MIPADTLAPIASRLGRALAPPIGRYRALRVDGCVAGWLDDARAARLASMTDVFVSREDGLSIAAHLDGAGSRSAALERVARDLAAEGLLTAWRDERYAVAPAFGADPWFVLERAAARFFGIHTYAAHVNGTVARGDGDRMWLARRSHRKSIDPGMLDNLVAGGIAAGLSVAATVGKEAWEEAGIPAPMAARARLTGTVEICREQRDGLQRETIFVHDLELPADFMPSGQDFEVVGHRLVTMQEAARLIAFDAGPDAVTADASLVVVDFLVRHGHFAPDAPGYERIESLRHPSMTPG